MPVQRVRPTGPEASDSDRVALDADLDAVHRQTECATGVFEQAGAVEAESGGPRRGIGEEHGRTIAQAGKTAMPREAGVEQGLEGSRPRGVTLDLFEERRHPASQGLVRLLIDHGVG